MDNISCSIAPLHHSNCIIHPTVHYIVIFLQLYCYKTYIAIEDTYFAVRIDFLFLCYLATPNSNDAIMIVKSQCHFNYTCTSRPVLMKIICYTSTMIQTDRQTDRLEHTFV